METLTAATFTDDARRRLAREGVAMPDGSFPIRNRSDLRNAIRALGRARNPEAARVHIQHRARALGLTGMLPEAWGVAAAGFDPSLHPHRPGGSHEGGQWAPTGHDAASLEQWRRSQRQQDMLARSREDDVPQAPRLAKPKSFVVHYKTPRGYDSGAAYQEHSFHTAEEAEAFRQHIAKAYPDVEPRVYASPDEVAMYAAAFVDAPPIGLAPLTPPAEWFENPRLDAPTPLTVTADGRVYGHLAEFGKCHRGIAGRCVFAPRSKNGYSSFYAGGSLQLDDGSQVRVGRLTVNAHHAPLTAGPAATAAHYDHSGSVAAFVRAGEDQHGIWVAGATKSDATPEQIRDLRANPPSGDWRNTEGRGLELVAALAVPVPGFPVMAVAASGFGGGEEVTALILGYATDEPLAVVAGAVDVPLVDAAEAAVRTRVLAARIRGGVDGLATLFR